VNRAHPITTACRPQEQAAGAAILRLAMLEAKRLLRHPVLLVGAVWGSWYSLWPWRYGEPAQPWSTANYSALSLTWAPLYVTTFVVANLAALREGPSTTAELFRCVPTRYSQRTAALLVAGFAPVALTGLLCVTQLALITRAGGVTIGDPPGSGKITPTPAEVALPALIAAMSFAAGVAVARTVRSRLLGAVGGIVGGGLYFTGYWIWARFPTYFVVPNAVAVRRDIAHPHQTLWDAEVPFLYAPTGGPNADYNPNWYALIRDLDGFGWHLVYLTGVTLLLTGYALRRSGYDPRVSWVLSIGAVLVTAGIAFQLVAHSGPFPWWGDVGAI
jgi:hypothetical protein